MADGHISDNGETDLNEQNDENRLIVEAKIPYSDLEFLTDLGEGNLNMSLALLIV